MPAANPGAKPKAKAQPKAKAKAKPKAKAKAKATPRARTALESAYKEASKKVSPRSRSRSASKSQRSAGIFTNNGWEARPYQQEAHDQFHIHNKKRQLLIWHRRAGKDSFSMNFAAEQMEQVPATYWHMFPLHSQARRAIWMGIDRKGQRFIDQAFDVNKRVKIWNQDMMIEMENGATWQLLGSDYYDRLVGANTKGVVFSEWALCDPRAWDYVRPILRENDGWAIFITTYRGRNHAYQMVQRLRGSDDWHVDVKTVEDTHNWDGSRILTDEDIAAERADGMVESLIQQEYYCNPMASATGAVYGPALEKMAEDRRGEFPYDPRLPVIAAWSFEFAPANFSVVLMQPRGSTHRVIWSKAFMFHTFADALAAIPYRVHNHVIKNLEQDWRDLFMDMGQQIDVTKPILEGKIAAVTNNTLQQCEFDTSMIRGHERENNENLWESLNGYTLREIDHDTWSNKPEVTKEIYLVRAMETYGIYAHQENIGRGSWSRQPNYSQRDRGII